MANKKKTQPEKKISNTTEKATEEVLADVVEIEHETEEIALSPKEQMIQDVKDGKVYVDIYEDTYKEPFPG